MLFSEDEDVDVQKESGLVASAKITLFEVEINISFIQSEMICV